MRETLKIFTEIALSLLLSAVGVMVAGLILGSMASYIELVPGFIVLVPALMNIRGCIASAFAARLGTALHVGIIDWKFNGRSREELKQNVYAVFAVAAVTAIIISAFAYATCYVLNRPSIGLIGLTLISLFSALLATCIMTLFAIFIAVYSMRRGIDPDDVTIPALTTLGDMITILAIFLAIILFGGVR